MENTKEEATQEELNTMPIKNAQVTKEGNFQVDVNHPEYGWIPFLATPYDCEEHGRKIFERVPKEFKVIPQVVEPAPVASPPSLEELIQTISTRLDELEKKVK